MISRVYTCKTWNLCRKCFFTLHSHNMILTTFLKLNFRVLHLHNLESLPKISLHTTLAQPDFLYIGTTWFQGSTLVQIEIFIFIVKLHISRYARTPWFSLHSQNMISVAYESCCCVYFLSYTYFLLIFMSKLSLWLFFRSKFSSERSTKITGAGGVSLALCGVFHYHL